MPMTMVQLIGKPPTRYKLEEKKEEKEKRKEKSVIPIIFLLEFVHSASPL